jgi:hypothetical protein
MVVTRAQIAVFEGFCGVREQNQLSCCSTGKQLVFGAIDFFPLDISLPFCLLLYAVFDTCSQLSNFAVAFDRVDLGVYLYDIYIFAITLFSDDLIIKINM